MTGLLVGRDAESAALRGRLASPGVRPGPVVLVAGEAGAGKTTLVEDALAATATAALRGRAAGWACPAYEVLASALRPPVRGAAGPVPGVLAQIMPELGAPPAEPGPAALAAAVCSVLAGAAAAGAANGGGLALFLDDLQWADEATLSLLPALADAAADLPVTVVGCYRSDELPRGHHLRTVRALLRRNHQLAEIELGPLGDDDVARMLTVLLGAPPAPALAAVVASRSDGLPFAVEELAFALRDAGRLTGPTVPEGCVHNAHMYYLLANSAEEQHAVLAQLKEQGIGAVFHYIPLHSAPAGLRFGRAHGDMKVTDDIWSRLIRLPLWPDMTPADIERVLDAVKRALSVAPAKQKAAS